MPTFFPYDQQSKASKESTQVSADLLSNLSVDKALVLVDAELLNDESIGNFHFELAAIVALEQLQERGLIFSSAHEVMETLRFIESTQISFH